MEECQRSGKLFLGLDAKNTGEVPNSSGIYQIKCLVDGYVYIGGAKSLHKRYSDYRKLLNEGNCHNKTLQYAWMTHGQDNFLFEVLEHCGPKELSEREYWHISNSTSPLFNLLKKERVRSMDGITPEGRQKRSEAAKLMHAAGKFGRATWRSGDRTHLPWSQARKEKHQDALAKMNADPEIKRKIADSWTPERRAKRAEDARKSANIRWSRVKRGPA